MYQGDHSAILSTFITLPFTIKTFVLSIPESFVRGGPTLMFFDEGRERSSTTISGPSSARQQNAIMAFRWHADDGPTLNAGLVAVIFQGTWTCIARKPYIFGIFQGGRDLLSPPPPPPLRWSHTCYF